MEEEIITKEIRVNLQHVGIIKGKNCVRINSIATKTGTMITAPKSKNDEPVFKVT